MDSAKSDHAPGRAPNETFSEKFPTGVGSSLAKQSSHLSLDTQSGGLRTGTDSPATAARTPDGPAIEEIARSQHFPLRTLPGMWLASVMAVLRTESH